MTPVTQARNRINARKRKARKVAMDKASELEMRAARCQSMGLSLLQDATKAMVEAALIRFTWREGDA